MAAIMVDEGEGPALKVSTCSGFAGMRLLAFGRPTLIAVASLPHGVKASPGRYDGQSHRSGGSFNRSRSERSVVRRLILRRPVRSAKSDSSIDRSVLRHLTKPRSSMVDGSLVVSRKSRWRPMVARVSVVKIDNARRCCHDCQQ